MKKIIYFIILSALIPTGVYGASTLYEYYAQNGLNFPSVSERRVIAHEAGITPYSGSYDENTALLEYLQGGNSAESAYLGGSNPQTATSWTLASSISSSATTITLVSLNDPRGNTPTAADFATTTYLVIEPNSSSQIEIVACPRSGLTISTKTFTNCTRGLAFYGSSEAAVTGNQKSHSAGSRVIQSNVGQFYNLFVDKWDTNTLYGKYTYASSTLTKYKFPYYSDDGNYIWYDTSSGAMGFATSSNEFAFGANGTQFTAGIPLNLTSGILSLATSTNEFDLDTGTLSLNLYSDGGLKSDSNGLQVDTSTTISALEPVYASSTLDGAYLVSQAATTTPSNVPVVDGFALTSATNGNSFYIQTEGIVRGFTGLTAGADYYLATSTAGQLTTLMPTNGYPVVYVGKALSSTQLQLDKRESLVGQHYSTASGNPASGTVTLPWYVQKVISDMSCLGTDNNRQGTQGDIEVTKSGKTTGYTYIREHDGAGPKSANGSLSWNTTTNVLTYGCTTSENSEAFTQTSYYYR